MSGIAAGDVVRWEWLRPDGAIHKSSQVVAGFSGRGCFWDGMTIAGEEAGEESGNWQVRVLVNHQPVATASFGVTADDGVVGAHGRLVRQYIHAHFTGMIRLGFAVIRALCNGPGPLSAEALALMRDDLSAAADALSVQTAVLRFDPERVRGLRDRLGGLTGDTALTEVNNLFGEILAAVRAARVGCHAGTNPSIAPPVYEGLTLAGYRLGITVALAVCFNCDQPVSDDVAAYIRAQLDAARAELSPYASCLQGFNFGQFGGPRLGAPFPSRDTHIDLSALFAAIQTAILSNDCTCDNEGTSPGGSTGTLQGVVRNASNGQPIAGATVTVAGTSLSANTGADGSYTLNAVPSGAQTLRASASGFISTDVPVSITAGQTLTQNISLSPTLASGEIRITLNWTKDASRRPNDLDMHLAGPNPGGSSCFHVYYSSLGSLSAAPFALLEVDNIQVTGDPPTETIRIGRLTPGIYHFYVHDYSGEMPDGLGQSRATVQVFSSSGLLFSQTAPTGNGRYWTVFTLNGSTGAVSSVNQLGSAPPTTPCR